jgi:hypothetical protein
MKAFTGMEVVNKMGTTGYDGSRGRVDLTPVTAKLKEVYNLVDYYQKRTPPSFDLRQLLAKLKEAEAIGVRLKLKADSGKL